MDASGIAEHSRRITLSEMTLVTPALPLPAGEAAVIGSQCCPSTRMDLKSDSTRGNVTWRRWMRTSLQGLVHRVLKMTLRRREFRFYLLCQWTPKRTPNKLKTVSGVMRISLNSSMKSGIFERNRGQIGPIPTSASNSFSPAPNLLAACSIDLCNSLSTHLASK